MEQGEILARLRAAVPANVRLVCETLTRAGHETVTVGGAVRDAILGRTPGDWDIATSATPDQVIARFDRTIPTGLQHGTVTIVTGKGAASHVEVTTFRGEGAYTDARRPDHVVFGVPLVEDLARRDLRINAIAYDPERDRLIDPFDGQRDLVEQRLRAVGPTGDVYRDAVARFSEDGLRVMRAVRFAAVLEFALDPETERGIEPALPSLARVSKERISDELRKILAAREPSRALRPAERTGILKLILPELDAGFDAWAGPGGRTEAINRWLGRVDRAPAASRLGALVSELAAPDDHVCRLDRQAARFAADVLRRLKFSNDELAGAAAIVGAACAPLVPAWTDGELRRMLVDITRPHAPAVIGAWRAGGAEALAARAEAMIARKDPIAIGELAVTGNDLIQALELPAGPAIGRLLVSLLDRVLEDPALNTRADLLRVAQQLELELGREMQ